MNEDKPWVHFEDDGGFINSTPSDSPCRVDGVYGPIGDVHPGQGCYLGRYGIVTVMKMRQYAITICVNAVSEEKAWEKANDARIRKSNAHCTLTEVK